MRTFFSMLLLCAFSFSMPVSAKVHTQQADIENLAEKMATSAGVNKHIMLSQLMTRIEGVEKAIGTKVDYRLALQIADCSGLTAHPDDPGKYGDGIKYSKIKAELAVESCSIAHQNGGDGIGLVLANLSRAYNKSEDYKSSLAAAKKAVSLNYPFADVLVANHYEYGDGVEKSESEQFRWYKSAADKGVSLSMRATSNNYRLGKGTAENIEKAYYWALKAIESNDGKGFYQMGKILEAKAANSRQPRLLLALAKQSYEIADENGLNLEKAVSSVNKKLNPNRFSPHAQKFSILSGRKIDGVFVEENHDLSWYLLKRAFADKDGNIFAIARNSHDGNLLTVWYQHAANKRDSGWYISFTRTGVIDAVRSISVTSTIAGKKEAIALDLSDSKIKNELFYYSMTGRISYRDVLLLAAGKHVKIRYQAPGKSDLRYTMALNDPDIVGGVDSTQTAKIIIVQLVDAARKLDKNCCNAPGIEPLSDDYENLYKRCKWVAGESLFKKDSIRQDCHMILKNSPWRSSLAIEPFKYNLARLLREIDGAIKK